MAHSIYQFYRNGFDNQKRADMTIDFKRTDIKNMKLWTCEQKKEAISFIISSISSLKITSKYIIELLETNNRYKFKKEENES